MRSPRGGLHNNKNRKYIGRVDIVSGVVKAKILRPRPGPLRPRPGPLRPRPGPLRPRPVNIRPEQKLRYSTSDSLTGLVMN